MPPKFFNRIADAVVDNEVVRDIRELGSNFTSYPTEGFVPVDSPRALLTNILEGIRTGTVKTADVGSDAGALAGGAIYRTLTGSNPVAQVASRTPYARKLFEGGEEATRFTGRVGGIFAPYLATSVAAPEAAAPAFGAQGVALAASAIDRFERGLISGQEATLEIVMNAGPVAAGPIFRAIRSGNTKMASFLRSGAGDEAIEEAAQAADRAKGRGTPRKLPKQMSRMTVEERVAQSHPDDIPGFMTRAQKVIDRTRRQQAQARLRIQTPMTMRPPGKKGGIYIDDITRDENGRFYPERILQADALEHEARPLIASGSYVIPARGRGGKSVTVSLNTQEAAALQDLYNRVPSPTATEIERALRSVQGRAGKITDVMSAPEKLEGLPDSAIASLGRRLARKSKFRDWLGEEMGIDPEAAAALVKMKDTTWYDALRRNLEELQELFPDDIAAVQPVAKKLKKAKPGQVTPERVAQIKNWAENHARRIDRLIERPLPQDTPELRAALRDLDALSIGGRVDATGRPQMGISQWLNHVEELEHRIASDRKRLEVIRANINDKTLQSNIRASLESRLSTLEDTIRRLSRQKLSFSTPAEADAARRAGVNVSPDDADAYVEAVREAGLIRKVLNGEVELPANMVDDAREAMAERPSQPIRARIEKAQQEWNEAQATVAELRKERAALLQLKEADVPGDIERQKERLLELFGAKSDDLPPILSPQKAKQMLNSLRNEREARRLKARQSLKFEEDLEKRTRELLKQIQEGLTGGRVPAGANIQKAGVRLRDWQEAVKRAGENPNGITKPATAVESMLNYARIAMADVMTGSPRSAAQAAKDIADTLTNVTNRQDGTGARAFIVRDGKPYYGRIALIHHDAGEPAKWLVDFVPDFTRTSQTIPNVRLQDLMLEYKTGDAFDAIGKRHQYERDSIANMRSQLSTILQDEAPEAIASRQGAIETIQNELRMLEPLRIDEAINLSPTDLLDDVNRKWALFEETLLPQRTATTNARDRMAQEGLIKLMNSPLPRGAKGKQAYAARQDYMLSDREYVLKHAPAIVDDPMVEELNKSNPMLQLLTRHGRDIDSAMHESSLRNWKRLPRRVRGMMDLVTGRGFPDQRVANIFADYRYQSEGAASRVLHEFEAIIGDQWRKLALQEHEKAGMVSPTRRPSSLRFAKGDLELEQVLSKGYKGRKPSTSFSTELNADIQAINSLRDDLAEQVHDFLSRQHRVLLDHAEAFDLPPEFKKVSQAGQLALKRWADVAAADAGSSLSQGYLNNLMLSPEMRKKIPPELISKASPIRVIAEAFKIADKEGLNPYEHVVDGNNLLMAEPLAFAKSSLMANITKRVKELGIGITNDDIIHTADRWSIKGLDKWTIKDANGKIDRAATTDLQNALKDLENGLNRLPDWKGLQKFSQAVASMALTFDANIVSVQGYSAIASRVLYDLAKSMKNPLAAGKAFSSYMNDLRTVISDEGFYTWYRNNIDEVQYFADLGMKVGVDAFIAGPKMNKLPFENLPFLGRLPKTAREFNDLQFNRLLLVLKVQGIRQQLDTAQILRKLGPTSGKSLLKIPGVKDVVDEAGGVSNYLYGQPEEIIRAAVRSQNNKLGGIDLDAQGIKQHRQAAEQILTITPGFLRAQLGMLSTALTRPHTVEGWMATTGIAQEVLFALGVATMFAHLTGNSDKVNYTDMTRADWMAVPFDDSYVPIIPRIGVPRLAARTLAETVDAAQGEGFDGGRAVQSFAQGRMSPALNTIQPWLMETDFLGRRYRDNKDRLFASMTSFMPIFFENVASESRERVAQDGWGGLSGALSQTPLQFAGKSVVPRPPIEKLNEIAANWETQHGRTPKKWFDLGIEANGERSQDILLENPEVKAAYDDFEYYNQRRASPKEIQVEGAFKDAEAQVDSIRSGPIEYNGKTLTMEQAHELLEAGEIDGDEYRERLRVANVKINQVMQDMERNLDRLGFDLTGSHEERVKRLRTLFKGSDENAVMTMMAMFDIEKVQPEDFLRDITVEGPDGPITYQETDWDAWGEARDEIINSYPTQVKTAALAAMQKWEDPGVLAYREAAKLRDTVEELPRYRGLDNEQADKIDAMTKSFRDLNDTLRAKIGLPGSLVPLPDGLSRVLRAHAVKSFVDSGFIKTEEDLKLALMSIIMVEKPLVREYMRGPQQLDALLKNPELLMYYPYLMGRVPVWMRGRLPANLQPQFDVFKRYQGEAA